VWVIGSPSRLLLSLLLLAGCLHWGQPRLRLVQWR